MLPGNLITFPANPVSICRHDISNFGSLLNSTLMHLRIVTNTENPNFSLKEIKKAGESMKSLVDSINVEVSEDEEEEEITFHYITLNYNLYED